MTTIAQKRKQLETTLANFVSALKAKEVAKVSQLAKQFTAQLGRSNAGLLPGREWRHWRARFHHSFYQFMAQSFATEVSSNKPTKALLSFYYQTALSVSQAVVVKKVYPFYLALVSVSDANLVEHLWVATQTEISVALTKNPAPEIAEAPKVVERPAEIEAALWPLVVAEFQAELEEILNGYRSALEAGDHSAAKAYESSYYAVGMQLSKAGEIQKVLDAVKYAILWQPKLAAYKKALEVENLFTIKTAASQIKTLKDAGETNFSWVVSQGLRHIFYAKMKEKLAKQGVDKKAALLFFYKVSEVSGIDSLAEGKPKLGQFALSVTASERFSKMFSMAHEEIRDLEAGSAKRLTKYAPLSVPKNLDADWQVIVACCQSETFNWALVDKMLIAMANIYWRLAGDSKNRDVRDGHVEQRLKTYFAQMSAENKKGCVRVASFLNQKPINQLIVCSVDLMFGLASTFFKDPALEERILVSAYSAIGHLLKAFQCYTAEFYSAETGAATVPPTIPLVADQHNQMVQWFVTAMAKRFAANKLLFSPAERKASLEIKQGNLVISPSSPIASVPAEKNSDTSTTNNLGIVPE